MGTTGVITRQPGVGPHHLGTANRLVLGLLHSPLHALLDPGICELSFAGRRSGRLVRLPVMYAREGRTVVILVGHADAKRWWRNFHTPHPVTVTARGETNTGTGRVVPADDPTAQEIYWSRHPGVRLLPGDRLVRVDLDREPSCA
ncbi:nitroreductase/quinone reductase family protein [Longispora sp. K20-0274]|uniref:nitroreductase/quinone reductase family protein n=1 Tax=Longispora sp. K20-0274 TaxID=3088255 RepID=UPI00399B4C26